jgi:ribosomal protein L34E
MDIGKVRLIEGMGWLLRWDEPINCHKCGKAIAPPFYWCKQFKLAFCKDCERSHGGNLCHTMQKEHIHYNIMEVQKDV